ncbi:MAG: AsmA family protein [Bradyrhizobiaceae bacterium]|nr:AsmA family protein [Bradyrhizobiaceae bacterium]
MQHALLALAIALILAIVAALAAPAYVNWNDWRAAFEDRATALAGAPVRIRGRIEASLLPTPAFVFRDVAIGDPDKGTGVRVGEVRGILSLGPLLRGVLEAEEFVLVRPAIRVTSEGSGRPVLASLLAAGRATGVVALARVSVERGSLVIDDRASGELSIFDEITADGELRAREGPLRIDATFLRDGRRWSLRAGTGRFGDEGAGRVRLTLERMGDGTLFDADGMLSLANAAPRFDGKVSANRRRGPGLPWQINANAKATEKSVALDGFELTVGASAAPIDLTGQVQFEPRRGGRIDGTLNARRVDLDLVSSGGEAAKGLPGAAAALREMLALLNDLPLQGRIEVAAEAVAAGGGTVRDAKAELGLRENSFAINSLEARLPGRGTLTASGSGAGNTIFNGTAAVEAEDASALLRWALADAAPALPSSGPLRLAGKVEWADGRIAADEFEFAFGEAKLGGRLRAEPADGKRRAQIEADLHASGVDLDRFVPFVQTARGWTDGADLALTLDGRNLRAFGRTLARVDASVSRAGDALAVERFVVDDFEGLSGLARGRIAGSVERPSGRIDFELESRRPDGLAAIVAPLLGDEAARIASAIAGSGRPLRLYGAALGAGAAAGLEVTASGYLAEVELSVAAHFDTLARALSEAHLMLETGDAGKLVSLIGLKPGLPAAGEATLEVLFAKPETVLPVTARLSVPGSKLVAEGELRKGAEGRIEPRLDLRLEAGDLRPLLSAVARSSEAAVPGQGSARLVRKGDQFMLERIDLKLAGSGVKGGLTIGRAEEISLAGNLAIERARADTLLALLVGSTEKGKAPWPASRLDPSPVAGTSGKIELEVKELQLADGLAATAAKFNARLAPGETSIEVLSAELAGGKLTGSARFVRGAALGFDGRASLASFAADQLLAPLGGQASVRGLGNLTLTIAGNGETPAAVVGSLAGQGTLALEALEIDRLDPNALSAVLAIGEEGEPRDEAGVVAALAPALAKGPLRIGKIESPIVVAGGVARTGRARTQAGPAQVTAEGNVDLSRLGFEAAVEIEAAPPAGLTMRPAATVRWRGPLAAPERSIDAAALATAIALRAMERETKRIEERDRALPKRSDPVPPAIEAQPLAAAAPLPDKIEEGSTASVPGANAPSSRIPQPPTRPRSVPPAATMLPPLAPPIEIRPAPRILGEP